MLAARVDDRRCSHQAAPALRHEGLAREPLSNHQGRTPCLEAFRRAQDGLFVIATRPASLSRDGSTVATDAAVADCQRRGDLRSVDWFGTGRMTTAVHGESLSGGLTGE